MADQVLIAVANLEPWLQMPAIKTVRLCTGTGVHEFDEGSAPILLAEQLRPKRPKVDIKMVAHGMSDIDYDSTIIITPPYCLPGAHGIKATRSIPVVTVGMVAIEVLDGTVFKVHRLMHRMDIRTKEVL